MTRIATIGQGGKTIARGRAAATTSEKSKVDKRSQRGAVDWVRNGEWVRVKSSNVSRIRYDREDHKLFVEFKGGAVYYYSGVSTQTAKAMFNAESMGKYVWKLRRAGYVGVQI